MKFEEVLPLLRAGKAVNRESGLFDLDGRNGIHYNGNHFVGRKDKKGKIISVIPIDLMADDWYEIKSQLLDKTEKRYLAGVLRPFRKYKIHIVKESTSGATYQIRIFSNAFEGATHAILLPEFGKDEPMYEKMEAGIVYTAEELELFSK